MRVQARTMADTRTEPSPPTPLIRPPSNRLGRQETPAKSLLVPAGEGLLPLRCSANQEANRRQFAIVNDAVRLFLEVLAAALLASHRMDADNQ
jgi:hypothetical protein